MICGAIRKVSIAAASALLVFTGAAYPAKLRLSQASADVCLANCASQNESCRRVCPITLGSTCLNACDSQAQTCRQNCRPR